MFMFCCCCCCFQYFEIFLCKYISQIGTLKNIIVTIYSLCELFFFVNQFDKFIVRRKKMWIYSKNNKLYKDSQQSLIMTKHLGFPSILLFLSLLLLDSQLISFQIFYFMLCCLFVFFIFIFHLSLWHKYDSQREKPQNISIKQQYLL